MKAVSMVVEAMNAGAREVNACKVLGNSARSVQRWRHTGSEDRWSCPDLVDSLFMPQFFPGDVLIHTPSD